MKNPLRNVAIAAAITTMLFYTTGVDWQYSLRTNNIGSGIEVYVVSVLFAMFPYGYLVPLLHDANRSIIFKIISLATFCIYPIIAFSYWRLNDIRTDGWDYIIVPVIQWILLFLVDLVSHAFRFINKIGLRR